MKVIVCMKCPRVLTLGDAEARGTVCVIAVPVNELAGAATHLLAHKDVEEVDVELEKDEVPDKDGTEDWAERFAAARRNLVDGGLLIRAVAAVKLKRGK